jgi:hypothetical protein
MFHANCQPDRPSLACPTTSNDTWARSSRSSPLDRRVGAALLSKRNPSPSGLLRERGGFEAAGIVPDRYAPKTRTSIPAARASSTRCLASRQVGVERQDQHGPARQHPLVEALPGHRSEKVRRL